MKCQITMLTNPSFITHLTMMMVVSECELGNTVIMVDINILIHISLLLTINQNLKEN